MSQNLCFALIALAETMISAALLMDRLRKKLPRHLHLLLWGGVMAAAVMLTWGSFALRAAAVTVGELVLTFLLFEDAPRRKGKYFLFMELLLAASVTISCAVFSLLFGSEVLLAGGCACGLMSLVLFSLSASLVFQFTRERRGVEFGWLVGTLLLLGLGECLAILAAARAGSGLLRAGECAFCAAAAVCMVAANLSVGLLAPYLLKKVTMADTMVHGQEISSMEYRYYELSLEKEKKLRQLRHDMANQIQIISSLLADGENQRAFALMQELREQYDRADSIVYCSNPVINIVLSNKKSEAEKKGIESTVRVKSDLAGLPISDFDLSTVICNLLDNAIRGCESSGQKNPRLVIELLQKNGYLVIRVLNSCRLSMNIEGAEHIESTKSGSRTHGWGMPIIAGVARKYRGDFVVTAQNGIFTATAVMSLKGETKEEKN